MIIETQTTPDSNILNFYPPQQILPEQQAYFIDSKSLRKSPLAENLFDIGGIKSIFITHDMISITKENKSDWNTIKPQILAEIMDFITSGEDIIISSETTSKNDADTVSLIINLLNARIRPTIQKDNGDIQFRDFDDGVVYVEMLGRCVGCPYASRTLKDGVEKILKMYIPEVKEVKNISEKK